MGLTEGLGLGYGDLYGPRPHLTQEKTEAQKDQLFSQAHATGQHSTQIRICIHSPYPGFSHTPTACRQFSSSICLFSWWPQNHLQRLLVLGFSLLIKWKQAHSCFPEQVVWLELPFTQYFHRLGINQPFLLFPFFFQPFGYSTEPVLKLPLETQRLGMTHVREFSAHLLLSQNLPADKSCVHGRERCGSGPQKSPYVQKLLQGHSLWPQ